MRTRRRFKQQLTLQDRLLAWSEQMRKRAEKLPAGKIRDDLMNRARQADTATNLDDWANSPGLRRPR